MATPLSPQVQLVGVSAAKSSSEPRVNEDHLLMQGGPDMRFVVITDGASFGDPTVPAADLAYAVAQTCMAHLLRFSLQAAEQTEVLRAELIQSAQYRYNQIVRTIPQNKRLRSCTFVAVVATPHQLVVIGSGNCFMYVRRSDGQLVNRRRFKNVIPGGSGFIVYRHECILHCLETVSVDHYDAAYFGSDGAYSRVFQRYREDPGYANGIDRLERRQLEEHVTSTTLGPLEDDTTFCRLRVPR